MDTASKTISEDQIHNILMHFQIELMRSRLPHEPVSQVINSQAEQVAKELVDVIRKHVEARGTASR